jgi:hypothetical protein
VLADFEGLKLPGIDRHQHAVEECNGLTLAQWLPVDPALLSLQVRHQASLA